LGSTLFDLAELNACQRTIIGLVLRQHFYRKLMQSPVDCLRLINAKVLG
jgi:hypothetical protein